MAKFKATSPKLPPEEFRGVLRRLWNEWMTPHLRSIILLTFLAVLTGAATGLYPICIKYAFEAFENKNMDFIYYAPFFIIIITGIKGFSLFALTVVTHKVVTRIETDMQLKLYTHMISSDIAQITRESPASLTQRFTTDFTFIKEALTRLSTVFLRETCSVIALLGAMIYIDWFLTLIAAVVVPFVAYPINKLGKRLRRVATITQEQMGLMAGMVSESFSGVKVAKTYEMEPYLSKKAKDAFEEIRDLRIKSAVTKGRLDPLMEMGGGAAVAMVFVLVGIRIMKGDSTIGDFSGFISALLIAAQPIRVLGNLHAILQEASSAIYRFYKVIDEKPTISNAPHAKPLKVRGGRVEFRNVAFRYNQHNDIYALNGISFVAPQGKTTALVGHSGSGKSTILSLTARLYDVLEKNSEGVFIDEQNIKDITLHSLRQAVSIVTQEVTLFDDTVRTNIAFGKENATDTEIIKAAKAAAAHDFIMKLPDGYNTRVGVAGGRLSGGERQRVSIARAFLKNAPILLLDEATSALDSESESLVQTALTDLMKERTTLVVAHRLSTIKNADLIIVMENGRIAEQGTHLELLNKEDGVYTHMYRLQVSDNLFED